MSEIIFPDTKKLHIEFLKTYRDEFLKLNNLKVGDEIELEFDYEKLSSKYKSRELQTHTYQKVAIGILKLNEDGCLYAESINDFDFYNHVKVRGNRYEYRKDSRKSIKKFGTGFIIYK